MKGCEYGPWYKKLCKNFKLKLDKNQVKFFLKILMKKCNSKLNLSKKVHKGILNKNLNENFPIMKKILRILVEKVQILT
jgi:hypothetical protein